MKENNEIRNKAEEEAKKIYFQMKDGDESFYTDKEYNELVERLENSMLMAQAQRESDNKMIDSIDVLICIWVLFIGIVLISFFMNIFVVS